MILTSISLEQVEVLEGIFATLTEQGWVIPDWLIHLRKVVTERDEQAKGS